MNAVFAMAMSLPHGATVPAMESSQSVDLAVVGLGAFGAAVAWHAARLGLDVVGVDQHHPPHELGSSHAETRVTRLAVGEGAEYVPFVRRAHEIWRELEIAASTPLLHDHGGLIIAPAAQSADSRWGNFVEATAAVAAGAGIGFEQLSAAESRERFPNFLVGDHEVVGREPTAGLVMAEAAVGAQLDAARHAGATLRLGCRVTGLERHGAGVSVRTADGEVVAREVVLCLGGWAPGFHDSDRLRVTRQVAYWFEVDDLDAWRPDHVGFAIWAGRTIEDYVGVFAAPEGGLPGIKVLGEQFVDTTTADSVDRRVTRDEIDRFYEASVRPRLAGVTDTCLKATACLYTNTGDDHFLIDRHPEHEHVTVVSACSGHGFKHSTAIGEAVARRTAGLPHLDLTPFARDRRPVH